MILKAMEKFYKFIGIIGEKDEIFQEYKRKLNDFLLEKENQIFVINQELQKEYTFIIIFGDLLIFASHSQECFNSYSLPIKEIVSYPEITEDTLQEFVENMKL